MSFPLERWLFSEEGAGDENTVFHRLLGGGGDDGDCDVCGICSNEEDAHRRFLSGGGFGGVHIDFICIYKSVVFLTAIYLSGQIASRLLRMPNLVGEIFCGIVLGPSLANFVPYKFSWVMLGEVGLIFLVMEAGIDINLDMLKLIGSRGVIIAFLGSIFPIALGLGLGFALNLDTKAAIATGAAFGPTSLGIALNILRSGEILNTPVGQLIIAAAVIDDMIALVVLSQLSALTGEVTVGSVLIPIVSAVGYLVVGGYLAISILPGILERCIFSRLPKSFNRGKAELTTMLSMLIALMPATKYSEASYLMGAFVAGLTFCSSPTLHHAFIKQFKRVMQWLMRIFFAASIGFQVPITKFGEVEVVWKGLVLTVALLGKLGAGFLVPNFYAGTPRFTGLHFRDCLITGFSLAAEGEFAFVIAFFAVNEKLIDPPTYSSIVLAVLLSTIIPPFALKYVIHSYNKKAAETVAQLATQKEEERAIVSGGSRRSLHDSLDKHTAKFFCLQTQSESSWGLLHAIMNCVFQLELEVIDHRSWHPRGVHTTLVNEMYVRDKQHSEFNEEEKRDEVEEQKMRIKSICNTLLDCIGQPDNARVKVTPWYPGVVTEIVEDIEENSRSTSTVEQRLLTEAEERLSNREKLHKAATKSKSVKEILSEQDDSRGKLEMPMGDEEKVDNKNDTATTTTLGRAITDVSPSPNPTATTRQVRDRRVRQKMRSTPVFGGSLFGEETNKMETPMTATTTIDQNFDGFSIPSFRQRATASPGHSAELSINGEVYQIRISEETASSLRKNSTGPALSSRGTNMLVGSITMDQADAPIVNMLQGYVRTDMATNQRLTNITEEHESNQGSHHGSNTDPDVDQLI